MSASHRMLCLVAFVLCAAGGCASKPATDGGAAGWRADKARESAEALALSSVHAAADAQAKAVPELYRPPEPPAELVREQRAAERLPTAVRGVAAVAAVGMAAFLFLRTSRRASLGRAAWLALACVALAAGGVAAAVFV